MSNLEILESPRVLWTAAIVGAALLFAGLSSWLMHTLNEGRYPWQRRLRARLGVVPGRRLRELFFMWLSIQSLLWSVVTWKLLHLWELHDIAEQLLDTLVNKGFSVGDTHVVPARVLAGLVWFLVLFTFTRWLRQKLVGRVLQQAGVELGARESLATLFGYTTFAIAAIVGLSAAGVDFSKLAIVAGALSVGIGFGLQDIFKNFISGLILLFEQRIRVGDQIVVGPTSGVVRKIHIRSTLIETADRESVVVPNSELLSNHVKNTNLYDRSGRIVLPVSVDRGSDIEKVKQLLLDTATAHAQTTPSDPASPLVLFTRFGDGSLDFELQIHTLDSGRNGTTASELRFMLTKVFAENGIALARSQRDLWIREMPEAERPAQRAST